MTIWSFMPTASSEWDLDIVSSLDQRRCLVHCRHGSHLHHDRPPRVRHPRSAQLLALGYRLEDSLDALTLNAGSLPNDWHSLRSLYRPSPASRLLPRLRSCVLTLPAPRATLPLQTFHRLKCSVPVLLIPAYQPGQALVDIVRELTGTMFAAIVVVDDGSGPNYRSIFDRLLRFDTVHVLRHAVNLGKGAALKTGINFILLEYPDLAGVVTADADGQHDPADILSVACRFMVSPKALVLGTRTFASDVPLRSRLGNSITRYAMRLAVGHRLSDTQTGLRAIPRGLLERLLRVAAPGYEFELEMLIAARHPALEVVEQSIRTIYNPGNPSSHFQPLRDVDADLLRAAALQFHLVDHRRARQPGFLSSVPRFRGRSAGTGRCADSCPHVQLLARPYRGISLK